MLTIACGIMIAWVLLATARFWLPVLVILTAWVIGAIVVLGLLSWLKGFG
jgi:hypothetical protein